MTVFLRHTGLLFSFRAKNLCHSSAHCLGINHIPSNITEAIPIDRANCGNTIKLQIDRLMDKMLIADYHYIISCL